MNYDLIVIGSGPGGYVAAIRASQLGMKVAVVEKESLGGICLNWGCIPTKALLKSAQVFNYMKKAAEYGIKLDHTPEVDFSSIVKRSRDVAAGMSNGIAYLFKKNKIDILSGSGKVKPGKIVEVTDNEGKKQEYSANHIIIATGARSRELPNLKQDGKKIIGYRQAITLDKKPESMVVVGSGAIGSEFAYFYNSIGTQVTLVEFMPNVVPLEDEEVSKQLARSFKKAGIKVMTNSTVESVDTKGERCKVTIKTKKGEEIVETDIVLSAEVYNQSYELINTPDVEITLKNSVGDTYNFLFGKTSNAYQLNAGILPIEDYTYEATVRVGEKLYHSQGEFTVSPVNIEAINTVADHNLLYRLTSKYQGELIYPEQLSTFTKMIKARDDVRTVVYTEKKFSGLVNIFGIFIFIVALLTAEWFIRKRSGSY
jgi:thioredoxin reductase